MATSIACYPWFDTLWQQWLRKRTRRPVHAYLLQGPSGLGKRDLLRQLAAHLLCGNTAVPEDAKPCGQCQACHWLSVNTHPDYWEAPLEGSIGIDWIRDCQTHCYQTPLVGLYKVFVLPAAERLTLPAANALLKILEEPPASCIWLLSTHQVARLPITIISRCQRIQAPSATSDSALPWLRAQLPQIPTDKLQQAWHIAQGRPLEARQLLDQTEWESRQLCYEQLSLYLQTPSMLYAVHQRLWPALQGSLQKYLVSLLRDMLQVQQLGKQAMINVDYAELVLSLAERCSSDRVWCWYDHWISLSREANLHVGYHLLSWLLDLQSSYSGEVADERRAGPF